MKITFKNKHDAEFFTTVKKRVDQYFISNNISKNGDWRMFGKSIFILSVFFGLYALLMADISSGPLALVYCGILGMFIAFIGFNISHDAAHGSYSSNNTINTIMSYTFDMLGTSSYMWKIMHNIIHHTYTNIPEHDNDLEPVFFIRLNPEKKVYKVHRFQHYYATFLYGLTSLSWVFKKDYAAIFKKEVGNYEHKKHDTKDIVIMFIAKIIYYTTFLILPMVFLHFTWYQILGGFFVMHFTEGLTLAIVFQLAHVVENTEFPIPTENGTIENNWAIHQLVTTANFARKSFLATFFFGGLNFQVEHHLFPKICHVHYPVLSHIIEDTAHEYGIPYNQYTRMWDAIKSHYTMLKKLGREELVQPEAKAKAA
jgi:linoleoyl-CoA desaturase